MSKQPDLHRKEARRNGGNLASYDQKPDRRMCVSLPFAFPYIVACAVSMDLGIGHIGTRVNSLFHLFCCNMRYMNNI